MTDKDCTLQLASGRHERCPGESCPFWADGACVLEGARPDIETTPGLAHHLLKVRTALAGVEGWSPFRRIGS